MAADVFLAQGLRIERRHDRWNGTSYLVWKPYPSMLFADTKGLLAFVGWPKKTPTGDALRSWLNATPEPGPTQPEAAISGFGPDPDDPTHNTRTIT